MGDRTCTCKELDGRCGDARDLLITVAETGNEWQQRDKIRAIIGRRKEQKPRPRLYSFAAAE